MTWSEGIQVGPALPIGLTRKSVGWGLIYGGQWSVWYGVVLHGSAVKAISNVYWSYRVVNSHMFLPGRNANIL